MAALDSLERTPRCTPSLWAQDVGDDVVRYAVVDGERSGVWMVRLSPA